MSSQAGMYRRRAADAKQRAARAKELSIKIALEHETAFWLLLVAQMEWIDKGGGVRNEGRMANSFTLGV
jgi:hypothetical protein